MSRRRLQRVADASDIHLQMADLRKVWLDAELGGQEVKDIKPVRRRMSELTVGDFLLSSQPSLRSAASSILKHLASDGVPKIDALELLRKGGVTQVVAQSLHDEITRLPTTLSAIEAGRVRVGRLRLSRIVHLRVTRPCSTLQPLFGKDPQCDFQHVQQCLVVLDHLLTRHPDDVAAVERAFGDLPSLLGALLTAARVELRDPSIGASSTTSS